MPKKQNSSSRKGKSDRAYNERVTAPEHTYMLKPAKLGSETVHKVCTQYFSGATAITQVPQTWALAGLEFHVTDIPDYQELASVYDAYRINRIDCTIVPKFNDNLVENVIKLTGSAASTLIPVLLAAVDLDDSNAPSDYKQVAAYNDCVSVAHFNEPVTVSWTPAFSRQIYANGLANGYERATGFIDFPENPASTVSVPHYGLKVAISPVTDSSQALDNIGYDLLVRYHLTLSRQR